MNVTTEDTTSHARLDKALRFGGNVYPFEFKVVEMAGEGAAMAQLREKDYAAKYRGGDGEVFLVGRVRGYTAPNIPSPKWLA